MAIQAQLCTENIGGFLIPPNFQDWNWNWNRNLLDNHNALLCSTLPTTQHHLLQQQTHHQSPPLFANAPSPAPAPAPALHSISSFHSQCQQIDPFIASQNERLRLMLQEQRKQQTVGLIKRIEAKTSVLMKQKDEEILKAASKSAELENLLERLEMESQAWQRAAQEKEAMVVSLNNTLEEMRESANSCCLINDDAQSCCEFSNNIIGQQEVDIHEADDVGGCESFFSSSSSSSSSSLMMCRNCKCRNSCVLFLPCRHLCACKGCDAFLDSCPVCKMPKKASIEALIS